MRLACKLFGHRKRWIIKLPDRPDDIWIGCPRCQDPSTMKCLVETREISGRPDFLNVRGLERLIGFLEGQY